MTLRLTLFFLAAALAGCAAETRRAAPPALESKTDTATVTTVAKDPTLYDQLGGQAAVEKLVDALISEIHGDKRINHLFTNTDIPYFRARLIEQLCQGTGGPCKYTGLTMEEAHSGLKITSKEFDQFVEDLNRAMANAGLNKQQQGRLLAVLGPMKPQVINQ
jgi:hemoglobin